MSQFDFQGIIPILVTPFDDEGRIDSDSLKALVEFNVSSGVHGLGIALGSEIFKLTDPERDQVLKLVVETVNGRVPVVMNTSAPGTDIAVTLSRRAQELGADALMIYPMSFMPTGPEAMLDLFDRLDSATSLPIILQDVPQAPISAEAVRRIALHASRTAAIKVETLPTVAQVRTMAEKVAGQLTVIGGAGGSYMIEEYRRGARGTMPFCSQPEDFVAVWDHLVAGDEVAARDRFDSRIMAINRLAAQDGDLFYHVHKRILQRRGVIAGAFVRSPTCRIDAVTLREIDAMLERYF
ncbi:dihydrodipicolinate synthase family protein [Frigidibacter sp. ROC022]|uniref:dihydrodipicolinate synthase family protein n=1 Tax=Frigidibacter sp. ROC022 TaxID=2971796 RepID=UPI00215AB8F6|nr:dihydrodipicolinate synthase family protein [Frigidibacter sp. ROC022]MCR8723527.1 dihydrodipicolinate synthase family protein [Frigidibacter sp. ROC022]